MKCLFFHLKHFHSEVVGLAKRPEGIIPEPLSKIAEDAIDVVAVFVTVERKDTISMAKECVKDILKFTNDVGVSEVVLCPFAHLSHDLAKYEVALKILTSVERLLSESKIILHRVHFGSDKSLLLDVYGHEKNVRFREYR